MKSEIIEVGSFSEDSNGHSKIEGWHIGSGGNEAYSLEELKTIAIENGTYSVVDHIEVEPLENFGIVTKDEDGNITGFDGFNTLQ